MALKPPDTGRFLRHSPKLLLLVFLVIGLAVYDDYGISWDESFSFNECGMSAWNAVVHGAWDAYQANQEKYHGPAFELVLIGVQQVTGTDEISDIYLQRHLVTFLIFWVSGIAFYRILAMRFSSRFMILSGICLYFLMPRIFADAFYNSKDLAFLSMTTICLYAMFRFTGNPHFRNAVVLGIVTGFAISIRVMGVLLVFITALNFVAAWIGPGGSSRNQFRIGPFAVFLLATVFFTVTFWPILWLDPPGHFMAAWDEMSRFSFKGNVLYAGELIPAPDLPWHYLPVWISITTPVPYLVLFIIGLYATVIFLARKRSPASLVFHRLSACALLFLPIISIILLKSVVYDGWRHVFFVYVPFCLIALEGLNHLRETLTGRRATLLLRLTVFIIIVATGYEMAMLHPYQNLYFNRLAGKNAGELQSRFEMDYWGLSYREALEKILAKDDSDTVRVYTLNNPGYLNSFILPESSRKRIKYSGPEDFEYFITNFRGDTTDHDRYIRVDSIMVDGAMISATFKNK